MEFEFTPGVARTIVFPMIAVGVADFAVSGDWTPVAVDCKISLDGGNVANTTNQVTAVGGTGSALWSLTLTAAETLGIVIAIQIVDAATKTVEDQALLGYAKDADRIEIFTINDTNTTPLVTAFEADRGLGRSEEATTSHFNNRNVLWLTGSHQGEMSDITGYSQQNARGFFTVTALVTPVPVNGDVFMVL